MVHPLDDLTWTFLVSSFLLALTKHLASATLAKIYFDSWFKTRSPWWGGMAAEVWRDWSHCLKPGNKEFTGNGASSANPRLAPLPTSSTASPYTSSFHGFPKQCTRWWASIQTPEHLGDFSQSNHVLCGLKPVSSKLHQPTQAAWSLHSSMM